MTWSTSDTVYVAGFVIGSVARGIGTYGCKRERTESGSQTVVDGALIAITSVGLFGAPAVYLCSSWLAFADYSAPAWLGWAGAAVFAAAIWMLWRSHADLGRNWSAAVRIREGHTLVTTGVYARIRHPMYTAHWIWAVAQALLLQNWIAGPALLVVFVPFCVYRIPREERMMVEQFGEEYEAYMAHTGRLLPPLGR